MVVYAGKRQIDYMLLYGSARLGIKKPVFGPSPALLIKTNPFYRRFSPKWHPQSTSQLLETPCAADNAEIMKTFSITLRCRSCHERHNRSAVEAARHLLAHVDEAAKSHEKLMEASRQYCTDAVLIEQQCPTLPSLASFSSYCQRSVAVYKMFGDCLSVNTVDQLRATRKTNKAVSIFFPGASFFKCLSTPDYNCN